MANLTAAEHPELVLEMTAMERTTPAHYDEWNVRHSSSMFSDNVVCIPKLLGICRNKKDRLNTHNNIKLCRKLI